MLAATRHAASGLVTAIWCQNGFSQPTTATDAAGSAITYGYSPADRLHAVGNARGESVITTFDPVIWNLPRQQQFNDYQLRALAEW